MRRGLLAVFLLVVVAAAGSAAASPSPSAAPGPGLWSSAANLISGRERHTATLLPDGRVLVTGGTDGLNTALASSEIYDPKNNRWTRAAPMSATRLDHTATLLRGGKVLVVGGFSQPVPSSTLASAEIYNPTTNTWSAAAPMAGSRARHTATLLKNGRVLIVGGTSFDVRDNGIFFNHPPDAEIYDPAVNRWSVTTPMAFRPLDHTATLLADGRVMVAGGQESPTSVERYDPTQIRWSSAPSMTVGRWGHTATLLASGSVLVAGGVTAQSPDIPVPVSDVNLYDPRRDRWSGVASTIAKHVGHTATLLQNGQVLVLGGIDRVRPEVYDPARNQWIATGPAIQRYNHTATRLLDGRVLVAGGYGLDSLASVLLYDPTGVAPVPATPLDPRTLAALVLAAIVLGVGIAWSIPEVRLWVGRLGPARDADEWIS